MEIEQIQEELSMLQAGHLHYSGAWDMEFVYLSGNISTPLGLVFAAQLAALSIRGHLWFRYGHDYPGPAGMLAERFIGCTGELRTEEELLLDLLFEGRQVVRIAEPRPGRLDDWKQLVRLTRSRLKDAGLGPLRVERYRTMRRLERLRKAMRYNMGAADREWDDDPVLYRAGIPFAVLFTMDSGPVRWPTPPDDELYIPSLLPVACEMGNRELT